MRRYIRHHTGTIHSVNADEFNRHLAQARAIQYQDKTTEIAREATAEEITADWARQGFVYDAATDEARLPEAAAPEGKPAKGAKE